MNLRDYKEAIKCLDEAEQILGEKISDIFFRRSQARFYNKDSTYEDLNLALKDINKAISNLKNEIFKDDYLKLFDLIKSHLETKKSELERNIKGKIN